ncbi:MAG: enoyl-CoA hydratase-related protein [Candidatus Protistobacter heckmanni]|nr:enoyl-CoA hydratase-related protein [Candidatus Protistobacter heckmanni]
MTEFDPAAFAAAGLLVSDAGAVRSLTLNRPERMNAMHLPLTQALRATQADPAVRALVLTGAGGNFCTGADILRDKSAENEDILAVLHEAFRSLYLGGKPSVAAIQGNAFGAGLSLGLACDFIVSEQGARFGAPFTGIGLVPDVGMALTLPQRIGMPAARSMMLAGDVLDAAQAKACGLIDALEEKGGAIAAALAKAETLAQRAPLAVAAARDLINSRREAVDALLADELRAQQAMRLTEDAAEGPAAFREKRKPVFKGR